MSQKTRSFLHTARSVTSLRNLGRTLFAIASVSLAFGPSAMAANYTWISTSSANWNVPADWSPTGTPGTTSGTNSTDTATFSGAGTAATTSVAVDANRNVQNITFTGAVSQYSLTGGPLLLTAGGLVQLDGTVSTTGKTESFTAPIVLEGNYTFGNYATTTDLLSFSGTVTGPASASATLTLDGVNTGANSISGVIANGTSGTLSLVKTGAGNWTLAAANTYTGGTVVQGGTLTLNVGTSAGLGTITVGAASGTNAATVQFILSATNAIALGGSTGALSIGTSAGSGNVNLSGAITGTNNLIINSFNTAAPNFILSGSVNNTGSISNNSAVSTSSAQISGVIGTNVTSIIENSTTSPLTVSGTLNTANSPTLVNLSGTKNLTLSGTAIGTGNLSLMNNSATTGAVSVTGAVLNTGNINNTGTGTGSAIVSSNIAAGTISGIVENSATSPLSITGSNAFTGGVLVQNGMLNLGGSTSGGTGTLALGATAANANNAILNLASVTGGSVYANAITAQAGSTGTLTLENTNQATTTGAITLANNLTITGASNTQFSINGGVGGTGNLKVSPNIGLIVFGTNTINNVGSFSTSGTGTGNVQVLGNTSLTRNITAVNQGSTGITQFSGTNFYVAPTTITSGTLDVAELDETSHNFNLSATAVAGQTSFNLTGSNLVGLAVGDQVQVLNGNFNGIPIVTTITAVNGTNVTISNAYTGVTPNPVNALTFIPVAMSTPTVAVTASSGSTTITPASLANIQVGSTVVGTGFAVGTTVVSINGTTLTISTPTTGAISSSSTEFIGASSLGLSDGSAANLILNGGTLQYGLETINGSNAVAGQTYRLFTLGSNGGTLSANYGTPAGVSQNVLAFLSTGAIAFTGTNLNTTLTLTGSNIGLASATSYSMNTFTPSLGNSGGTGVTSLVKNGPGNWVVNGTNTFTGGVTVNAGTIQFVTPGSLPGYTVAGNDVVNSGGTLGVNVGGSNEFTATQLGTLISNTTFNTGSALGLDSTDDTSAFTYTGNITGTGLTISKEELTGTPGAVNQINLTGNLSLGTGGINVYGTKNLAGNVTSILNLSGSNSLSGPVNLGNVAGPTAELLLSSTNALGQGVNQASSISFNLADSVLAEGLSGTSAFVYNGAINILGRMTFGTSTANSGNFIFNGNLYESNGATFVSLTTGAVSTVVVNGNVAISAAGVNGTFTPSANSGDTFIFNGIISSDTDFTGSSSAVGNVTAGQFGTVELLGPNSNYTGITTVSRGTLVTTGFNSVTIGQNPTTVNGYSVTPTLGSGLGAPTTLANGTIALGGAVSLQYIGTGENTDRTLNLTSTSALLLNDGSGQIVFTGNATNGNAVTSSNGANTVLTLTGTGSSLGIIAGGIVDSSTASFTTGLTKAGTATWLVSGATNSYSGVTTLSAGTLRVTTLANGGTNSSIGKSSNASTNLVFSGGTLSYVGTANASTDRNFNITSGSVIDSSGVGTLTFTGTNLVTTGTPALTLSGTNTGANTFSGVLSNGTLGLALNKTGVGTWILSGSNTFTSATSINAGILNYQNGAAFGTYSSIAVGAGATAQVQGGITGGSLGLSIRGTGAAGSTGALENVSGNNSYAGAINLVTAAPTISSDAGTLTLTGGITGGLPLTLSGSGNGVETGVVGAISNLTKNGTGTWLLQGSNTYTGSTTVNAGTLGLGSGGGMSNTPIAVASTGTLQINGNYTVGIAASTGSVTLSGTGSTLSMVDGTVNTLHINHTSGGAGLVLASGSILNLEVGATADEIILGAGVTATVSPTVTVNIVGLGSLSGTTQTLISAPGGGLGTTNFALGTTTGSLSGYGLTLNQTNNNLFLMEGVFTPAAAYWEGTYSSAWNYSGSGSATNFTSDLSGTNTLTSLPGSTTNVTFVAAGATNYTNTTLGQNFTINSLGFNTSGVGIGGTNTLTILAGSANGNTIGNGITSTTTGGVNTISAPIALGSSQTFTVTNSGSTLAVSGPISGAFGLTTAGAGDLVLSSTGNSYSGGTTISSGRTIVSNSSGSATGTGAVTVSSGGTLAGNGFIAPTSTATGFTALTSTSGTIAPGSIVKTNGSLDSMTLDTTGVTGTGSQAASFTNTTFQFDLGTGVAGTTGTSNKMVVLGSLALNFNNSANVVYITDLTSNMLQLNGQYVLFQQTGQDFTGLTLSGLNITSGLSLGSNAFSAYYNTSVLQDINIGGPGGTYEIVVDVVPEPSTWAMMIGGLALLAFYMRRRRQVQA